MTTSRYMNRTSYVSSMSLKFWFIIIIITPCMYLKSQEYPSTPILDASPNPSSLNKRDIVHNHLFGIQTWPRSYLSPERDQVLAVSVVPMSSTTAGSSQIPPIHLPRIIRGRRGARTPFPLLIVNGPGDLDHGRAPRTMMARVMGVPRARPVPVRLARIPVAAGIVRLLALALGLERRAPAPGPPEVRARADDPQEQQEPGDGADHDARDRAAREVRAARVLAALDDGRGRLAGREDSGDGLRESSRGRGL